MNISTLSEHRMRPLESGKFVSSMIKMLGMAYNKKWFYDNIYKRYKGSGVLGNILVSQWHEEIINIDNWKYTSDVVTCLLNLDYFNINIPKKYSDRSDFDEFIALIDKAAKNRGWFLHSYNFRGLSRVHAIFHPNYGLLINRVPQFVYHITNTSNSDSIMKRGLIPREKDNEGRKLPPRIYLYLDKDDLVAIANNWMMQNAVANYYGVEASNRGSESFALLAVDTTKLKGAKFYRDPEFQGNRKAVWTYSPIPASAIDIIDIIGR